MSSSLRSEPLIVAPQHRASLQAGAARQGGHPYYGHGGYGYGRGGYGYGYGYGNAVGAVALGTALGAAATAPYAAAAPYYYGPGPYYGYGPNPYVVVGGGAPQACHAAGCAGARHGGAVEAEASSVARDGGKGRGRARRHMIHRGPRGGTYTMHNGRKVYRS